jgi:hypothetical protein
MTTNTPFKLKALQRKAEGTGLKQAKLPALPLGEPE